MRILLQSTKANSPHTTCLNDHCYQTIRTYVLVSLEPIRISTSWYKPVQIDAELYDLCIANMYHSSLVRLAGWAEIPWQDLILPLCIDKRAAKAS